MYLDVLGRFLQGPQQGNSKLAKRSLDGFWKVCGWFWSFFEGGPQHVKKTSKKVVGAFLEGYWKVFGWGPNRPTKCICVVLGGFNFEEEKVHTFFNPARALQS